MEGSTDPAPINRPRKKKIQVPLPPAFQTIQKASSKGKWTKSKDESLASDATPVIMDDTIKSVDDNIAELIELTATQPEKFIGDNVGDVSKENRVNASDSLSQPVSSEPITVPLESEKEPTLALDNEPEDLSEPMAERNNEPIDLPPSVPESNDEPKLMSDPGSDPFSEPTDIEPNLNTASMTESATDQISDGVDNDQSHTDVNERTDDMTTPPVQAKPLQRETTDDLIQAAEAKSDAAMSAAVKVLDSYQKAVEAVASADAATTKRIDAELKAEYAADAKDRLGVIVETQAEKQEKVSEIVNKTKQAEEDLLEEKAAIENEIKDTKIVAEKAVLAAEIALSNLNHAHDELDDVKTTQEASIDSKSTESSENKGEQTEVVSAAQLADKKVSKAGTLASKVEELSSNLEKIDNKLEKIDVNKEKAEAISATILEAKDNAGSIEKNYSNEAESAESKYRQTVKQEEKAKAEASAAKQAVADESTKSKDIIKDAEEALEKVEQRMASHNDKSADSANVHDKAGGSPVPYTKPSKLKLPAAFIKESNPNLDKEETAPSSPRKSKLSIPQIFSSSSKDDDNAEKANLDLGKEESAPASPRKSKLSIPQAFSSSSSKDEGDEGNETVLSSPRKSKLSIPQAFSSSNKTADKESDEKETKPVRKKLVLPTAFNTSKTTSASSVGSEQLPGLKSKNTSTDIKPATKTQPGSPIKEIADSKSAPDENKTVNSDGTQPTSEGSRKTSKVKIPNIFAADKHDNEQDVASSSTSTKIKAPSPSKLKAVPNKDTKNNSSNKEDLSERSSSSNGANIEPTATTGDKKQHSNATPVSPMKSKSKVKIPAAFSQTSSSNTGPSRDSVTVPYQNKQSYDSHPEVSQLVPNGPTTTVRNVDTTHKSALPPTKIPTPTSGKKGSKFDNPADRSAAVDKLSLPLGADTAVAEKNDLDSKSIDERAVKRDVAKQKALAKRKEANARIERDLQRKKKEKEDKARIMAEIAAIEAQVKTVKEQSLTNEPGQEDIETEEGPNQDSAVLQQPNEEAGASEFSTENKSELNTSNVIDTLVEATMNILLDEPVVLNNEASNDRDTLHSTPQETNASISQSISTANNDASMSDDAGHLSKAESLPEARGNTTNSSKPSTLLEDTDVVPSDEAFTTFSDERVKGDMSAPSDEAFTMSDRQKAEDLQAPCDEAFSMPRNDQVDDIKASRTETIVEAPNSSVADDQVNIQVDHEPRSLPSIDEPRPPIRQQTNTANTGPSTVTTNVQTTSSHSAQPNKDGGAHRDTSNVVGQEGSKCGCVIL